MDSLGDAPVVRRPECLGVRTVRIHVQFMAWTNWAVYVVYMSACACTYTLCWYFYSVWHGHPVQYCSVWATGTVHLVSVRGCLSLHVYWCTFCTFLCVHTLVPSSACACVRGCLYLTCKGVIVRSHVYTADHEQDWQPYSIGISSSICDDHECIHTAVICLHTFICTYIRTYIIHAYINTYMQYI